MSVYFRCNFDHSLELSTTFGLSLNKMRRLFVSHYISFSLLSAAIFYVAFTKFGWIIISSKSSTVTSVEIYAHPQQELSDPSTYMLQMMRPKKRLKSRNAFVLNPLPHTGSDYIHQAIRQNILLQKLNVKVFDEYDLRGKFTPRQRLEKLRVFVMGLSSNDSVYIHTDWEIKSGRFKLRSGEKFEPLSIVFTRSPIERLLSSFHAEKFQKDLFSAYGNYTAERLTNRIQSLRKPFNQCIRDGIACNQRDVIKGASIARFLCYEECDLKRKLVPKGLLAKARQHVKSRAGDFLAIPMEEGLFTIMGVLQRLFPEICTNLGHFTITTGIAVPVWTRVNISRVLLMTPLKGVNEYLDVDYSFDYYSRNVYHLRAYGGRNQTLETI